MKNIVLSALVMLMVISCGKKSEFVAQIDGVEDQTEVFLAKLGKNNQPIPVDTAVVMNGGFKFEMLEGEPQQFNVLTVKGIAGNMFFIKEDEYYKRQQAVEELIRSYE